MAQQGGLGDLGPALERSREVGPKRDVLGDLTDAVRRRGLRMGYYYSVYEWYNPLWLYDKPRYVREHVFPQFKDLVTHNKPSFIFSDGEWEMSSADWHSAELLASLFNESPVKDEVVINDRWGGDTRHKHGGYWTTEYTAGMSAIDHAWEESRSIGVSPFRFSIYSIAAFWKANLTGESSAFLKLDRWIIIINATPLFMSIQT